MNELRESILRSNMDIAGNPDNLKREYDANSGCREFNMAKPLTLASYSYLNGLVRSFLTIIFLISFTDHTNASDSYFQILKNDIDSTMTDASNFGSFILNFPLNPGLKLAGATASSLIAMSADESVRDIFRRNHSQTAANYLNFTNNFGEIKYSAIYSFALYGTGFVFKYEPLRRIGRKTAEALALSGSTVMILKFIMGRARPFNNLGAFHYTPFNIKDQYESYPSGHSAVAFTIASVLSNEVNNIYFSALIYPLAASTMVSRMYKDYHWLSDVMLGASIGYFYGWLIDNSSNLKTQYGISNLNINPTLNGISLSYQF
ncbi:MAG: phosphatase PAP2 family protein [Candidatus Kapabacteria bacterium]|nr:phosphatase PAP2 family protein [Candidatus Kapabacteria bacterium]